MRFVSSVFVAAVILAMNAGQFAHAQVSADPQLLPPAGIPARPLAAQPSAPPAVTPEPPMAPADAAQPILPPSVPPATAREAVPQTAAPMPPPSDGRFAIAWEVRNRFRLFKEERDFQLMAESLRGRSILQSEDALAEQSEGRGWARNAVGRLCIDPAGRALERCMRDGVAENYLAPADHPITVQLTGPVPSGATCLWLFADSGQPQQLSVPCTEPVNLRVRTGEPTNTTVDIQTPQGLTTRSATVIEVRDLFIAGLGDSVASGEGNPDRPIKLSDEGFCFHTYLDGGANQYFRPGRDGYKGDRACSLANDTNAAAATSWRQHGAGWFNAACHRSLYSYQTRAAIALAVGDTHIAVTYLPLACTGATIKDGLFGAQQARECSVDSSGNCGSVPAQLTSLKAALAAARKRMPSRQLDLVFLTIGANDIDFSGLVADAIVQRSTERSLFQRSGVIGSEQNSRALLQGTLPREFATLREGLKPLLNGDLRKVVYVAYAHPALDKGVTCPRGRHGFDVHPSFGIDAARLNPISNFVQAAFLPRLRELALCQNGVVCKGAGDRFTFVNQHQAAFVQHGVCAQSESDPDFDRACFAQDGNSFQPDPVAGADNPLVCGRKASDFRAYAPRARWVRTANDSYFAAMTFPRGISAAMPQDIHDATWGVVSAVYGGALHPTAEGHAAMADAALPAAQAVLGLTPTAVADAPESDDTPPAEGSAPLAPSGSAPPALVPQTQPLPQPAR